MTSNKFSKEDTERYFNKLRKEGLMEIAEDGDVGFKEFLKCNDLHFQIENLLGVFFLSCYKERCSNVDAIVEEYKEELKTLRKDIKNLTKIISNFGKENSENNKINENVQIINDN